MLTIFGSVILAWQTAGLLLMAPQVPDETVQPFADQTLRYSGGDYKDHEFHFRLLAPPEVEQGQRYPLVLFLHGAGERGSDNRAQLLYFPAQMAQTPWREKYPCFLLAPQCPSGKWWARLIPGGARPATGDTDETSSTDQGPPPLADELRAVTQMLDRVLAEHPIDPSRVYLTGLSMGGFGSWHLAATYPERFAAVVPICGGGNPAWAPRLVKLPLWAVHGAADPVVPVARTRVMIEALRAADAEPKYSELEGVGHDSWTPAYSDPMGVVPWMFDQVRPAD